MREMPVRSRAFPAPVRALACLLASVILLQPQTRSAETLEYEVKAAFLLNFTRFIDWPAGTFADANQPFTLCIMGKDPFGRALDEVVGGEAINGRRLVIRRFADTLETQSCQIVFFSTTDKDLAREIHSCGRGVLTVGESDHFEREGGMINFIIDSRRVRFDINQRAAESAGLKLSSKLLSVARKVEK